MSECLPKIRDLIKQSGKTVSEPVIREMHAEMQKRLKNGITADEFTKQMNELIDKDMKRRIQSVRLAKLMALSKYEALPEGYRRNAAKGISAYEYLRSVIEGGALKAGDGLNLSAEGMEKTLKTILMKEFNQLAELKDEIQSGKLDAEIVQEKAALQGEGKSGDSGSAAARRAAEIFHAIQKKSFDMKRARNPMMRFKENYYFEATHSRERIAAVPREEWVAFVNETHGPKSFPEMSLEERINVLGSIYDEITSGSYGSMSSGGNILFSMARGRVLEPTDFNAFYKYHKRFGEGTISDVMIQSINRAAREISILEKFGPEWRNFLKEAYPRVYNAASPKERLELEKNKDYLLKAFRTATGDVNEPALGMGAKLVQGGMAWENMALNGSPVIASMPDFALQLGLIQDSTGKTQIEIAKDLISNVTRSATSPAEAREIALHMGIYAESYMATLARDLGTREAPLGLSGKVEKGIKAAGELYGKLTLMDRYIAAHKASIGITLGSYLSKMSEIKHADLPAQAKTGLARYGIGEAEWNTLRFGVEKVDFRGREVSLMSPEAILDMPDEVIENYLRKAGKLEGEATPKEALDLGRQDLALKVGAMINEHADMGTSSAGTRQRTFMYRGFSINDGMGKAMRMFSQFKSAALVSSDVLRRRYYSGADPKGSWTGPAQTATQLILMAAIAQYATDASQGKTPEDPRNPRFVLKTLTRSGAMGPWADVFLGELQRNGIDSMMLASFSAAAGPLPSKLLEGGLTAAQFAKAGFERGVEGRPTKLPNLRAFNWAVGQVPGQNLFWAKGALNYYFLNGVRESLEPGYTGTLQRKLMETPSPTDSGHQEMMFFDPADR